MDNELHRYIELTTWIRELSTPQITEKDSAETYRDNLLRSFTRIGELARINEDILNRQFYPLLQPDKELTDDEIEQIRAFCTMLMNPISMENLDVPMIYLQSEQLLADAERKRDVKVMMIALDNLVMSSYVMLSTTQRLYPCYDIFCKYRDRGYKAAERMMEWLDKERFASLPDEGCKEAVLANSRYISSLFQWEDVTDKEARARKDIQMMEDALSLADDPFYREHTEEYDWNYHIFRTLQYITAFTEFGNHDRFPQDLLQKINGYTKRLITFLHEEIPELEEECDEVTCTLYTLRNGYYSGEITLDAYKEGLRALFARRRMDTFDPNDFYTNFTVPYEYLLVVDKDNLSPEDKELLLTFYHEAIRHIYHMPKMGVLSFLLTVMSMVLQHFIEIEGGPDFETFCLRLMAALHPPTFVHSLSVTDITLCLLSHQMERAPEHLVGVLGTTSVEEVLAKKDEITEFTRHSALLHDVGKLFIIETIITYGRKLFASEFDLIKAHPVIGAWLLEKHDSTKAYVNAAMGHHRWFNGIGGYPDQFDMKSCPDRTIIALLTVADCLDAATDLVGRNYKQGKTFDQYIAEIERERDTRYAGFVIDLLADEDVRADVASLLENVRDENYRKTFELLKTF